MGTGNAKPRTGQTTDYAGRSLSLLDPYPLMLLRRFDRIDEPTVEAILADLGDEYTHIKRNMWIGFGSIGAVIVIMVIGLGATAVGQGSGAWRDLVNTVTDPAMLPIFVACIGGGVIAPWFAMRAKRFAILRGVMLGHHRCPHCGYGIRSVPANDGAVTCPECAAAWPEREVGACTARPDTGASRQKQTLLIITLALGMVALLAGLVMYWAF